MGQNQSHCKFKPNTFKFIEYLIFFIYYCKKKYEKINGEIEFNILSIVLKL